MPHLISDHIICCPTYGFIHLSMKRRQHSEDDHTHHCLQLILIFLMFPRKAACSADESVVSLLGNEPNLTTFLSYRCQMFHAKTLLVFLAYFMTLKTKYIPPKCWKTSTRLHDVKSLEVIFFTVTPVRT